MKNEWRRIMYICVEGVIGVGKTTLARMISDEFDFFSFLEVVEENPFLAKFYEDRERWAFQTQLFFLLSRYSQQSELMKILKAQRNAVSDYMFDKDRIFANMNLVGEQMKLYDKVFKILDSKVPKPDLIIYLKASVQTLMKRIAMRDRVFERNMDKEYISSLVIAYDDFFKRYEGKFITINADEVDFVQNREDFELILKAIRESGVEL